METPQIVLLLLALGYAFFSFVSYGETRTKPNSAPWRSLFVVVGGYCLGFAIFNAPTGRSNVMGPVFLALVIAPAVLISSAWFLGGIVAVLVRRNRSFRFLLLPVLLFPFAVATWFAIDAHEADAYSADQGVRISGKSGGGVGEI